MRALLVACATVTALATWAPASAAIAASESPPPAFHVINLHSAFEQARSVSKAGVIAGVVPARGAHAAKAKATPRAAAACIEPNCNLTYGGGPVQHFPHVYLLLWGPKWNSSSPAYQYLAAFYKGLGVTPDDTWSTVTSQYGDKSGVPAFGPSVYVGAFNDTSSPPPNVTPDNLAAEAQGFAAFEKIADVADAQIVVASQTGTCFSDGFAGSCGAGSSTGYCAWHAMTSGRVSFTNLPYQLDAGAGCGEDFVNATTGTYDGFSIVGGHEYAESITDPDPPTGWIDTPDTVSGGELADKCAWGGSLWGTLGSDPFGDVTLSTGTFAMQSLWSNAANSGNGACVMSSGTSLTVTNPGPQGSVLGSTAHLQINVSGGTVTSYAATGLPEGLSISSTGLISGAPGITAGTFAPIVTVAGPTGAFAASFSWLVRSNPGPVKGYAGKCVDDYHSSKINGTKVDLFSCNGQASQRITFTASAELQVNGRCITSKNNLAVIEACNGSSGQLWTRRSNEEYVISSNHLCLTDPRNSRVNGTQLVFSKCTDSLAQRWLLP